MSKPKTPATPDYKGAAEATAAGNEKGLTQQSYANRPTINTPWGSQTWDTSTAVDPSTGLPVTQWQQNISLSPQQQQALDAQTAIATARSNAALDMLPTVTKGFGVGYGGSGYGLGFGNQSNTNTRQMGSFELAAPRPDMTARPPAPMGGNESMGYGNRGIYSTTTQGSPVSPTTPAFGGSPTAPMSFGGPSSGGITVDPNYWRAAGQGAALGFQQPLQIQRQQQLETQLSNMGLARGGEAWRNEMRGLQDQNARDNLQAFGAGQSESNQMFNQAMQANNQGFNQGYMGAGLNLQGQNQAFNQNLTSQQFNQTLRQQQIAEMLQARSQPLNEMNALLSGQQIGMPQMPGSTQVGRAPGVDYSGVANSQYGAALNAANAQNASSASNTNAALQAAVMLGTFMFSDMRLKENMARVGELPNGIGVYAYNFKGQEKRELGVLAQEVQGTMPEAVKENENGYLMVDYNMVLKNE